MIRFELGLEQPIPRLLPRLSLSPALSPDAGTLLVARVTRTLRSSASAGYTLCAAIVTTDMFPEAPLPSR